jgi:hypothetical protein
MQTTRATLRVINQQNENTPPLAQVWSQKKSIDALAHGADGGCSLVGREKGREVVIVSPGSLVVPGHPMQFDVARSERRVGRGGLSERQRDASAFAPFVLFGRKASKQKQGPQERKKRKKKREKQKGKGEEMKDVLDDRGKESRKHT